ncbi:MAG TPA: hypothetical protein VKZ51_10080 [Cyclobacteriaceae bacterium]|nr:hypothetical protein [Cyclobacteriaceae bacterium]
MKKTLSKWLPLGLFLIPLAACQDEDKEPTPDIIEMNYTFEANEEGWIGGFADLPVEGQDIYELDISHSPLPEETDATGNSIRIQGHNRSDDLFMFLKKKLTGLSPSTTYQVIFDIEMASQYPQTAPGIGGGPGGSVFIKVGATPEEPLAVEEEEPVQNYLRMNIDKGNQAQEGTDMINVGTVGIEGEEYRYQLIQRGNSDRPISANTDPEGNLWLILGTDSGFEGLTVLYYNTVKVRLEKTRVL